MATMAGVPISQLLSLILLLPLVAVTQAADDLIKIGNKTLSSIGPSISGMEEATRLEIINCNIKEVEEDVFLLHHRLRMLRIANTTIHHWRHNNLSSFRYISFDRSTIMELHTSGIHFAGLDLVDPHFFDLLTRSTLVRVAFDSSTIAVMNSNAIDLRGAERWAWLDMIRCRIKSLENRAVQLNRGHTFSMTQNTIEVIHTAAFAGVCSKQVRFRQNAIKTLEPHSIFFGNDTCRRERSLSKFRRIPYKISANTLTCGPQLDWLRVSDDSWLPKFEREDYAAFRQTSVCAGPTPRTPVWQYLNTTDRVDSARLARLPSTSARPEPERTQREPRWRLPAIVAAVTAVLTSVVNLVGVWLCVSCRRRRQQAAVAAETDAETLQLASSDRRADGAKSFIPPQAAQPDALGTAVDAHNLYAEPDRESSHLYETPTWLPEYVNVGAYGVPARPPIETRPTRPPIETRPAGQGETRRYENLHRLRLAQRK
ncbi:uncharacterized protein LOC119089678 [Pollicipes pollicipes]|uniref:uncharacterized protein LOC119089678 n=1 Tax=Pollicipes pollicipes TaxID=41117 RepID=UPI0018853FC0|nr:uncharacterized protein LOC119089678 [Pollicipes pollicipes]